MIPSFTSITASKTSNLLEQDPYQFQLQDVDEPVLFRGDLPLYGSSQNSF